MGGGGGGAGGVWMYDKHEALFFASCLTYTVAHSYTVIALNFKLDFPTILIFVLMCFFFVFFFFFFIKHWPYPCNIFTVGFYYFLISM